MSLKSMTMAQLEHELVYGYGDPGYRRDLLDELQRRCREPLQGIASIVQDPMLYNTEEEK